MKPVRSPVLAGGRGRRPFSNGSCARLSAPFSHCLLRIGHTSRLVSLLLNKKSVSPHLLTYTVVKAMHNFDNEIQIQSFKIYSLNLNDRSRGGGTSCPPRWRSTLSHVMSKWRPGLVFFFFNDWLPDSLVRSCAKQCKVIIAEQENRITIDDSHSNE